MERERDRLPLTPYTVLIDSGEQLPYAFADPFVRERGKKDQTFRVQTAPAKLFIADSKLSVDYSLAGYEQEVGIERKSWDDFLGTLGQGRARFQRKLELLQQHFRHAEVVVEREWGFMLTNTHPYSKISMVSAFQSVASWKQRFPKIHWNFLPGRLLGEIATLRILDMFWRQRQHQ